MIYWKNTLIIIVIYNQALETPHRWTSSWYQSCNMSLHVGESVFWNPGICACRSRNPWNFCLWNPESWALKSRKQLKESGIPLTIGIQNPSFTDKESRIQCLESEIHSEESVTQDCLGFPYIRWNTNKTSFIYVILLTTSRRRSAQLVSGLIYPIE